MSPSCQMYDGSTVLPLTINFGVPSWERPKSVMIFWTSSADQSVTSFVFGSTGIKPCQWSLLGSEWVCCPSSSPSSNFTGVSTPLLNNLTVAWIWAVQLHFCCSAGALGGLHITIGFSLCAFSPLPRKLAIQKKPATAAMTTIIIPMLFKRFMSILVVIFSPRRK